MRNQWAAAFAAVLVVWLLGVAELALVVTLYGSQFAGLWELSWGSLWLAPGALVLTGLTAALLHLVWQAASSRHRVAHTFGLCVVALCCVALGLALTGSRHFELWWRRAGFIALLTAAGVAACYWLAAWARRPHRETAVRRATVWCLIALIVVELLNRFLLVRLYPAFHWALSGLSIAICVFAVSLYRLSLSRRTLWIGGATLAGALALTPLASERLARFDNYRWVLLEQAPVLGRTVRVLGWIAPPAELAPAAEVAIRTEAGGSLSLSGKDILLITIDALRADHLGAYGYARNTSPRMDELAATGVRFEYAYCATPHTSYSLSSLMTGKYIRPLLLQGAGADSETFAQLMRLYEYRTAAFYPPAVFFIDGPRFAAFEDAQFGFEYQKKEFLEGEARVQQLASYLDQQSDAPKVFAWVHLFGPHEPYEKDPRFDFGERDIDRYDSEIAAADHTVGRLVDEFRQRRPDAVVIVTSDHGEEFGEHGGRYHGSSVYEEQVRVPMIFNAPGSLPPKVVKAPVQTIDLLPTVLSALAIPVRPRIRGRDLGELMTEADLAEDLGFAYAETEEQSLLAEGRWRLICERRVGACRLFDVHDDPAQQRDIAGTEGQRFDRLKRQVQELNASHGAFEEKGLRSEGKGWPAPILRGLAGDGDAVPELAALLDDADVEVRRQAAKLLFELPREEAASALRLALSRDEDETVRRYAALAITRQGEGAALTTELLTGEDLHFRRLAALVLAEQGDRRGHLELVAWWRNRTPDLSFHLATQIIAALGRSKSKEAVWPLLQSLDDVRLRPAIARALAEIGDDAARGALAKAFAQERYHSTRTVLADALNRLGAENELVMPLRKWLGVPDPLKDGLRVATEADILEHVGGPDSTQLARARRNAEFGEIVRVIVPRGGNGRGIRLIARARNTTTEPQLLRVGLPHGVFAFNAKGELTKSRKVPEIHPIHRVGLSFAAGAESTELHTVLPEAFGFKPGRSSHLVVLAERGLEFESLAVVPLQDEPIGLKPESSVSEHKKPTDPASLDATRTPNQ